MSHSDWARDGLLDYGYNKDMIHGTGFKYDEFVTELKKRRPIFLQGYRGFAEGHSFVLDGYYEVHSVFENCIGQHETHKKVYLHYNFGWNENWDDWYSAYWRYTGKPNGNSIEFTLNLPDEANFIRKMTHIYNIHS